MQNQFDMTGYSPRNELILLVETKWSKDSSEQVAVAYRTNLIANDLLPRDPFFLLAYRNNLFLWREKAGDQAGPDYKSSAKPVLKKYLPSIPDPEKELGPESLEFAIKLWLADLASGYEQPDLNSEADKMLVDSGLFKRLKGGQIRRDLQRGEGLQARHRLRRRTNPALKSAPRAECASARVLVR